MARNRDRSHLAQAYAEVVSQESVGNSQQPGGQDVTDLARERAKRALGVHIYTDESGSKRMITRFQTGKAALHEIDCTKWLELGVFGEQFIRAWAAKHGVKTSSSMIRNENKVLNHFFIHLHEYIASGHQLKILADLTPEVLHSFPNYLDRLKTAEKAPLSDLSKQRYFTSIRSLLEFMKVSAPFKVLMPPVFPLKKIAYSSVSNAKNPTEALSEDVAARIDSACIKEMEEYMHRFKQGKEWCQEYKDKLPDKISAKPSDFTSLGLIVAALHHQVGLPVPIFQQLIKDYPALATAIGRYCCAVPSRGRVHGRFCDGGYATVLSYLYPTPRTMIPFVVMMARATLYNASTLLGLVWDGVGQNPFYGEEQMDVRVNIAAEKGRASKTQVRSFPKALKRIDNPAVILDNVKQYTAPIRASVAPELRNRIWQFIQIRTEGATHLSGTSYVSIKNQDDLSSDKRWKAPFEMFKREHDLPAFTLRHLRATGSEEVDRVTGGDIKAQQTALQHSASGVIEKHYNSGPARQRRREKLAAFMLERERWISTNGKSDMRDGKRCGDAVTPGFNCADMFASPMPGQKEGRMCSAYLWCPVCPLAVVDSQDPKALAYLIRIDDAIEDARDRIEAERWCSELAPILIRIRNVWLPSFTDPAVWDQAAEIIDHLPDILVE